MAASVVGRASSHRPHGVDAASETALPHWPLSMMVVAYPLWFFLGLGGFMWVVMAVPMAAALTRRRNIVLPRGMGLWVLFLVAVLGSAFSVDAVDRFAGYLLRLGYYVGATVVCVYLLNGDRSVSIGRIVRSFTLLWMATIACGYLAIVLGDLSFRSPMWYLMPPALLENDLINTLVTPGFADLQDIIGVPIPRPKAPFPYTNSWGSMVALGTPFALMALHDERAGLSPRLVRFALVAAVIPGVVSLNRGLWLSLGIGVLYVGFRLGVAGRHGAVMRLGVVAMVGLALLVVTPLGDLVSSRLDTGHSNEDRMALAVAAIEGATERPFFGWGAPRPNGNQPAIGSHGQMWMVTFSHGFVGAVAYVGALFIFWYRTRRQWSISGLWAHTVIVIAVSQMPYYLMIPHALFVVMAAVALAFRYQQEALATPAVQGEASDATDEGDDGTVEQRSATAAAPVGPGPGPAPVRRPGLPGPR
ncbi:MAG: hypothetical protein AAGD35_05800 [Actinomycetota bacterium]